MLTLLSILLFNISLPAFAIANDYNILTLGAKSDGRTDATDTLLAAWNEACGSSTPATINVPKGRYLISHAIKFDGKRCRSKEINFVISGTLAAPSNYKILGSAGTWIWFEDVTGVTISGGVLDGQGSPFWDCKRSGKSCPSGVTSLGFTNSKNVQISGLTSLDSQLYHIVIDRCSDVKVQNVVVSASGRSPNTDGIHVQLSTHVSIVNTKISTGDDCVSVGAGTSALWIENVSCGPGHGISIGSLGKDLYEPGVQNVTVKSVVFTGTENGVRIKSWGRPSNGFARNILFQHCTMVNVQNPIIIDQNYCPDHKNCPGDVSGVRISDVTYQDIHGVSATEVAIKFNCSPKYPCNNIKLEDVKLTYKNQQASSSSSNVKGSTDNFVQPQSCL